MTNQEIKDKILQSIADTQKQGYTLVCDEWGSTVSKCACAFGCVLVSYGMVLDSSPKTKDLEEVSKMLNVSLDWIYSFIDGFDGNGFEQAATIPDAWLLGQEIRQQTLPIEEGEVN
jgi:hypothetical protein